MVPPTVPPGGERVRICLRAEMGDEVVRRLVGGLEEWVNRELGVGSGVDKGRIGGSEGDLVILQTRAKL